MEFEYKKDLSEDSEILSAREWRFKNEGLNSRCTAKERKEGVRHTKFNVGIGHHKRVVLCKYLASPLMESIMQVRHIFPKALKKSTAILVYDDPSQNPK